MSFLAPGALWALLALAVPLALHLRRRRVGRTIPVGSIRHLEPLPSAERRGLRLRDRRLLALRALIIAALALLLARPVLDRTRHDLRPFALVDSLASPAQRDRLQEVSGVSIERLDDPWRRIAALDDSLPAGMPLVILAPTSSDLYTGQRPILTRMVEWAPVGADPARARPRPPGAQPPAPSTQLQRRALFAALAAAAEEFGPLTDSAGWMTRLPDWWRDSLAVPAFPLAVARAVAPARTALPPVALALGQVVPRTVPRPARAGEALDLHWWFWGTALLLFLLERAVAMRWRDPA